MTRRVLVSAPYIQPVIDKFRPLFDDHDIELLVPPVTERLSEAELMPLVADIVGIIAGDDQITERVLSAAPRLKVISKWGTGTDSFDHAAAAKRGIPILNTPGAFTDPVADSVMAYILCFARKTVWMHRDIARGIWNKKPCVSLAESTLGVIGVGNVGKAVVHRAMAFGMRILGNDIIDLPTEFISKTGLEVATRELLLEQSDFISLNCDLNPTSRHLMSVASFRLMKSTAYLINTARGPIIDEEALISALKAGQIAGAGLDVFEEEPLSTTSPLRQMDQVLLAPHNSNSSPRAWEYVHKNTINNLLKVLKKV